MREPLDGPRPPASDTGWARARFRRRSKTDRPTRHPLEPGLVDPQAAEIVAVGEEPGVDCSSRRRGRSRASMHATQVPTQSGAEDLVPHGGERVGEVDPLPVAAHLDHLRGSGERHIGAAGWGVRRRIPNDSLTALRASAGRRPCPNLTSRSISEAEEPGALADVLPGDQRLLVAELVGLGGLLEADAVSAARLEQHLGLEARPGRIVVAVPSGRETGQHFLVAHTPNHGRQIVGAAPR